MTRRDSFGVRLAANSFLVFWLLLASFPFLWIMAMSFKLPVDAFAADPLAVIAGPATRAAKGGITLLDILFAIAAFFIFRRLWRRSGGRITYIAAAVCGLVVLFILLGKIESRLADAPLIGVLASPLVGMTFQHYRAVWVDDAFYRQFLNSAMVAGGVVSLSLAVAAPAGYALARAGSNLAFWLLAAALVFRALPHSVLVAGYLQPFIDSGLYGRRIAVIIVLAAINQPFTIWMLRSFFANIPAELDEAALVDGCSRWGAFRRVIMPVMWPGVITAGLFSFLLAYNDYLVTALLLDGDTMTMVPSITRYFNRETTMTDQVEAVAAAVSITAPLFVLVMVFQRQIVSGLTQGAVKG